MTIGSSRRFRLALASAGVVFPLLVGAAVAVLLRPDPFLPIVVAGTGLQERADSALAQAEDRYPHVLLEVRNLSHEGILIQSRWAKPESGSDDFGGEVRRRVEDQREATIAVLQALARSDRSLKRLGVTEDGFLIAGWSRSQILGAGDPRTFRDFASYSAFQLSADDLGGYAVISGALNEQ